ncbi:hypothetical protein Vadar_007710 [Vaccinium darrowii]|uniref:Uncharacterized protein n=1 Tax=Vaccinium darrowii TaxID=229202 RepID=A0ACB7YCG1_9ERIC|nr:hypothetical protein Vadar_007710 [Vaccinium darrowii]
MNGDLCASDKFHTICSSHCNEKSPKQKQETIPQQERKKQKEESMPSWAYPDSDEPPPSARGESVSSQTPMKGINGEFFAKGESLNELCCVQVASDWSVDETMAYQGDGYGQKVLTQAIVLIISSLVLVTTCRHSNRPSCGCRCLLWKKVIPIVEEAPECFLSGKATQQSDVYAFGIVLLEIVCGLRPGPTIDEFHSLVDWVWSLYREGRILDTVDERLGDEYVVEEAQKVLILALACSHPIAGERPKTQAIVEILSGLVSVPYVPPFKPAFVWPSMPSIEEDDISTMETRPFQTIHLGPDFTPKCINLWELVMSPLSPSIFYGGVTIPLLPLSFLWFEAPSSIHGEVLDFLTCYNTHVREVQDPSMLLPHGATVPKPWKKKTPTQKASTLLEHYAKGFQELLPPPVPPQARKKAFKRGLKKEVSPFFQPPENKTSNSFPD